MKKFTVITLAVLFIGISSFTTVYLSNWKISEDYSIKFEGRGASGTFGGLSGTVRFNDQDITTAFMDVSVQVNTIETGNNTKNKHAKGEKWFDAKSYPKIIFTSTDFEVLESGYIAHGTLNIKGIKKEISIPFAYSSNTDGATFEGNITVNRQDFNVKGPSLASASVSDDIEISIKVPVTSL